MRKQKFSHVDDPAAVGARLRAARERAGVSQRALAFPGCSAAYISQIERGERTPSLQVLRELARRLGVAEEELASGGAAAEPPGSLVEAEAALRLGDVAVAERLYGEALEHATDGARRAEALAGLGELDLRAGRPAEAIDRLRSALELAGGDELAHATWVEALGRAYATAGEFELAIELFDRALGAAEAAADAVETLRFAVLLSNALIDAGNFGRAEEIIARALSLANDSPDPLVRARVFWSQSRLHAMRNDTQTAARYARKVLEILELSEHTEYTAMAYQLLAHIELDRGRPSEALEVARKGERLLGQDGHRLARAQLKLEEARALAMLGEHDEAAALAMSAAGLFADADPYDAGRGYALLAEISAEVGQRERAIELYELAIELLDGPPNRYLLEAYTRLADLLEAAGRSQEALALLRRAMGVRLAARRPL